MLPIASFAMKGPLQAYITVVLFAALTVWIAPFGILAGAVIALVTLRIGVNEGLKSLLWGVTSNIILTMVLTGNYWPALISIAEYMLPVWLLSLILRQTNSLGLTLQFAMIMAGLGTIGFHLIVSDPAAWWLSLFNQHILPLLETSGVVYQAEVVKEFANHVTLLLAVFAVMLWYLIITIARRWQSELYHPGQFKMDFYQLKLSKATAYIAIMFAILGFVFKSDLIYDLSGVIVAGLMFQGIAIAHQTVATKQLHTAWLVGVYVLLFLFPQTMLILATIGLIDIWVDFRNRWEKD